jgi:PAS domain S-box-containing protein
MLQYTDALDPLGRDERHRQFGALLEFSPDAIAIVDAGGLLRECNPAAERMLETTTEAGANSPLRELLGAAHRAIFDIAWLQLLAGHAVPRVTALPEFAVGSEPPLDVTVAPIRVGETLAGAVVILRDATVLNSAGPSTLKQMEAPPAQNELSAPVTAEFDGPAGLPGRRWLQWHLSESPTEGLDRGVAVFDIDAFAMVIATYGPDTADAVLTHFGELLKSIDTPGVFSHWQADAFVWTVDTDDPVAALDLCVATLTKSLKDPFQIGDDRGWLTLSIGLATNALVAGGDLLAAARDALQSAKLAGGSTAVYYDQSMEASATSSFRLASDLHHAIENDELRLHYQPIMDLATKEIAGVEALVRWERPGVGLLAPAAFLDTAERTGQSVPLGNWVVRTACKNALRLGSHSGGPRTMSINVSASQLRDPGLIGTLRDAMLDGECAPATIVIEVTESVLLHDLQAVAASLEAIRALDIGIDLDDFGTGYSSLQYLRNLPIDRLKVDQGFVAGLGINGADTAIVASTIALAHALGLRSIAEGVETIEQLTLLRKMGCDFAQGYLLSRPTDMETLTTWLDAFVPSEIFGEGDATSATSLRRGADAADRREKRADRRDLKADRRDVQSAARESKANTRDSTATTRDTEANTRDTEANTRDLTATTRDAEANTREYTADGREQTADERDRIADLRDEAASEREQVEDDRQRTGGRPGLGSDGGDSHVTRSAASQDRSRAKTERLAEAGDRARAGRGRNDATAERTNEASARTQEQAAATDEGDR